MNKEAKTIVRKTVKIACVTCAALGGAALIASGAALKAMTEGGKYLKDAVKKILAEEPQVAEPTAQPAEAPAEEAAASEPAETAAEEGQAAQPESQENE